MEKQKMLKEYRMPRYLVVTLLALPLYAEYGLSPDFILYALFFSVLASISHFDLNRRIVPDILVLAVFVIGIAACIFIRRLTWIDRVAGCLVAAFPLVVSLRKGGMGGGDIKLMAAGGFLLGFYQSLLALLLACVIGVVYAAVTKRRGFLKAAIPFAPCLAAAMCFSVLAGSPTVHLAYSIFR